MELWPRDRMCKAVKYIEWWRVCDVWKWHKMILKKKNKWNVPSTVKYSYLKLKSGEAHRTATLGMAGTSRIAIATWFFHKRDKASRWLSDGVFFVGAELRSSDARLSLTGLLKFN